MDVESVPKFAKPPAAPRRRHGCWNACLAPVAVLVLIAVLIVILTFTVFKAKHPVTTVNSAKLRNLQVSVSIAPLGINLNVTVDVDISVKNPNKVAFKYENSTCLLNYRGEQVGQAPVPAGEIGAGQTKQMNLTLNVLANRLLSNSQAMSDFLSGVLPLNTYTKMPGTVTILGLFKVHVVSTTSCDLSVLVSNSTLGNQQCRYETKL